MDPVPYHSSSVGNSWRGPSATHLIDPDNTSPEERDDGWLLGFVDILTLLLTLFVLLLAFTQLPRHIDAHTDTAAPTLKKTPMHHRGTMSPPPITIPADIRDQVGITTTASDVNLVIKDDVLFDAGSDILKPAGLNVLAVIAKLLMQNDRPVSVEGHTDNTPIHTARFPSNWELSAARATNVTRRLIQLGVNPDRLRAIGFADTKPLDSNATAQGRARNRRVSLVIHLHEPGNKSALTATQRPIKVAAGHGSRVQGQ